MNALYLTVFVSLVLVVLAIVAFAHANARGEADHADRLALLPLEDDDVTRPPPQASNDPSSPPNNAKELPG